MDMQVSVSTLTDHEGVCIIMNILVQLSMSVILQCVVTAFLLFVHANHLTCINHNRARVSGLMPNHLVFYSFKSIGQTI